MGMDRPNDQTTGPSRPGVMTEGGITDAISLLTDDHRKVDRLFRRYEELGAGNEDERGRLVDQISDELSVHAAIEEAVFYPAVRELLAEGDRLVDESLHEHQEVKDNLAELDELEPGLARFDATVATLISNVRHHVREEEGEVFPKLRSAIGEPQLVELGRRLSEAKDEESGSILDAPMVTVTEEDIVVSMFEAPEPPPVAQPPRAPATARTAKRPTPKRSTRRPAKKSTAKKSTAKRVAARKSTAKKSAKKSTGKKSTSRKSSARRPAARKSTGRKSTGRKSTARRAAKKSTGRKSTARRAAKKSTGRKSTARRVAKKSTGRKSTARRSTARKSTKKSTAKRASARKATARKSATRSRSRTRISASRSKSSRSR